MARSRAWTLAASSLVGCAAPDGAAHVPSVASSLASSAAVDESLLAVTTDATALVAPPPQPPPYATLRDTLVLDGPSGRSVFVVTGANVTIDPPPSLVTVLHARCVDARENCEFLRDIAAPNAILVCPTGNTPCGNGTSTWAGDAKAMAAEVEADTNHAEATLERPTSARAGDVLFGSSAGAFGARNIVTAGTTRWSGLVLVGAKIEFAPNALQRDGVRRVLLAAPDWDDAAATMRSTRKTLCRADLPAKFVSLGKHPHGMVEDSPGILALAMPWVFGREDAAVCDETAP